MEEDWRRRRCLARWSRGGDELKATSGGGSKQRRPDLSESEEDEMCGATRGVGGMKVGFGAGGRPGGRRLLYLGSPKEPLGRRAATGP
jgi:hypothetical protein